MTVSKNEREAYEQGMQDRDTLNNLNLLDFLTGVALVHVPAACRAYSGQELEAYEKGANGEGLDEN